MSKIKKTKNQIIVVPTTQTSEIKTRLAGKEVQRIKTTKLRPIRSKSSQESTLAYYNCLIDQVANPLNTKVNITKMASHCHCKKGEVQAARQEHKQQLVRELAKNYLAFGENLGHYLHADIVGCAKELKK